MAKPIAPLDLNAEYELFADDIRRVVNEVLDSQQFINGPAVGELESALSARLGTNHAVAVNSGTDALLVALMALNVGPGDEVILPPFTFMATAGVVARVGAKPVFVDIDPQTFNIDPSLIESSISPHTKAIMVVHLFGQCAEMDAIRGIADRHGLPIIEDAAQAIDATYKGRPACSLGDLGCLSFYPTKNLGGFGEGGMVLCDDGELDAILRSLRNHGELERYHCDRIGGNFRLDTMKAAILLVKLDYLSRFTERRRRNAALYDQWLTGSIATPPYVGAGQEPVYHQYTVMCKQRDELRAYLQERGVGSAIYYPVPLHLQQALGHCGYRDGDMPVAEQAAELVLSLPCHPMLSDDDVRQVATLVHEFGGTMPSNGTLSPAMAEA